MRRLMMLGLLVGTLAGCAGTPSGGEDQTLDRGGGRGVGVAQQDAVRLSRARAHWVIEVSPM